jgi:hypothetical protein
MLDAETIDFIAESVGKDSSLGLCNRCPAANFCSTIPDETCAGVWKKYLDEQTIKEGA